MLILKNALFIIRFIVETLLFTLLGMFMSYINLVEILITTLCTGIAAMFVIIAVMAYVPAFIFLKNPNFYQTNIKIHVVEFKAKFNKDYFLKTFSKKAIKKTFKPILSKLSGPIFARIVARLSLIGIGIGI